jgi:hypothetical protein
MPGISSSRLLVSFDRCQALIIRSNSRICFFRTRSWAPSAARHARNLGYPFVFRIGHDPESRLDTKPPERATIPNSARWQNLGDDAVDARLARDRIGGALVVTGQEQHLDAFPTIREKNFALYQPPHDSDTDNFARYLANECYIPMIDSHTFHSFGHLVRVGTFPISIPTAEFDRLARRAIRSPFVKNALASLAGHIMMIGVDALDYTKGLPLQREAFEHFRPLNVP